MKTETFLIELEGIVSQLGYRFRKEKGSFKGGFCVLQGDKLIMMNKMFPNEFHIGQIIRFLSTQDLEDMYIKPLVRKEIDLWQERLKEDKTIS
ncbi:hypothetical protein QLX67_07700 [Balneolaceae bacterium ANBcel3]|nr:hypothetical protein [Balneolaceae bacterium ANBcel3]